MLHRLKSIFGQNTPDGSETVEVDKSNFEVTKDHTFGDFTQLLDLRGGTPPVRGTHELLQIYSKSPWFRAVVNKISKEVAHTNWRLYTQTNQQGKSVRNKFLQTTDFDIRERKLHDELDLNTVKEITDHPLLDLLNNGNDMMLGSMVMEITQ